MANIIYIETHRIGENKYHFEWSVTYKVWFDESGFLEYEAPDRLRAAIINLGLACRWFSDAHIIGGIVQLKSDIDGLDYRYEKEHDVLFHLIYPDSYFEAKKNAGLYVDYQKYLTRIRQLMRTWRITVELKP